MSSKDYQSIFNQRGHLYNAAISLCPTARDIELRQLLDLIDFNQHSNLCDAPAGGGFVAEGVRRLHYSNCPITCVEPAERFAAAIADEFTVHISGIDRIPVNDEKFNVIASLAGLHHIEKRQEIFDEWRRVTVQGGQCVVADVASNTGSALFLNGFVNQHCPGGHAGIFFEPNEFSDLLHNADFEPCSERLETVPWHFSDPLEMGLFCRNLFGLEGVTAEEVAQTLKEVVGTRLQPNGQIALLWQLQYAKGVAR